MKKVLNVYKPVGFTPLQTIELLKSKKPQYVDKKIAYAGRLDPMASGVLLLIVEPETKRRERYQSLDKKYNFEILFGVETDTYDALGIPRKAKVKNISKLQNAIDSLKAKGVQKYPPYSSKAVKGKPLYWWARKGKLEEINIPEKEIEIYSIKLKSLDYKKIKELRKKIIPMIKKVEGDFRQEEIISAWKSFFKDSPEKLPVAQINIECSSGVYIRGLANEIGKQLKTGAIASEILRTKVGKYELEDSLRLNHP